MGFDSGMISFIKMLIIIGLISMFYMIVMQKIKEQNHKITSLLSLVTTMASEITTLKQCRVPEYQNETMDTEEIHPVALNNIRMSSISVSDSESESDSDSDSEEDITDFSQEKSGKIDFFEIDALENEEKETELPESQVNVTETEEPPEETPDYKKLSLAELVEVVVSKEILPKEKAKKLKKKELLELL